jgi:ArsR family transcriptional regulator
LTTSSMVVKRRTRRSERNDTSVGPVSLLELTDDLLEDMTAVFKLLSDRNRLKIVLALAERGQMHVNALCALLGQSQPAVSHHLTLMRMVGLVGYDRNGKHNFYYLASDHLRDLIEQFFSDTGNARQSLEFEDFALVFSRREGS